MRVKINCAMIIRDLVLIGEEYHAKLIDVENNKITPVIIQKGGGRCEWTAIEATNKNEQWEILFVGSNKPSVEDWVDGDHIMLGYAIR